MEKSYNNPFLDPSSAKSMEFVPMELVPIGQVVNQAIPFSNDFSTSRELITDIHKTGIAGRDIASSLGYIGAVLAITGVALLPLIIKKFKGKRVKDATLKRLKASTGDKEHLLAAKIISKLTDDELNKLTTQQIVLGLGKLNNVPLNKKDRLDTTMLLSKIVRKGALTEADRKLFRRIMKLYVAHFEI